MPVYAAAKAKQNALPVEARRVLETGTRFVLLSLSPGIRDESAPPFKETFHGYGVLGKMEVRDTRERMKLLEELYKGVADSDGSAAFCFNPRHGISAILGQERVDLVICFECLQIAIYSGHGHPLVRSGGVLTTRSPQPIFNRALERAKLPFPKDR